MQNYRNQTVLTGLVLLVSNEAPNYLVLQRLAVPQRMLYTVICCKSA